MAQLTPEFMQELLVEQLIADVEKGNYVSAAANARNILRMAQHTQLRADVLDVAQRTVQVLETRGYSEQRFLQEMRQLGEQEPPCPANALPVGADGTCPAGYFPLFARLNDPATRRCCGKFQQELADLDQNLATLHDRLPDTADRLAFRERFMVTDPQIKQSRDEMLGVGITPHIAGFVTRYRSHEAEQLERKMEEITRGQTTVGAVFGNKMTPSLYQRLIGLLGSTANFAQWYVQHDWTLWWVAIYLFRFLALFGCMFLRVVNGTKGLLAYLPEIARQMFGIYATAQFVSAALMPNILTVIVSTVLISVLSHGTVQLGGWMQQVMGTFAMTRQLMSMLSLPGFSIDLYFLLRDVWSFGWSFVAEAASLLADGNVNPYTIASAGLHKASTVYCDIQLQSFFVGSANMVGDFTGYLMRKLCELVVSSFGKFVPGKIIENGCVWMQEILQKIAKSRGKLTLTDDGYFGQLTSVGLSSMDLLGYNANALSAKK